MWPFERNLKDVLGATKVVRPLGVKFKIKKIDTSSFLDGSKVMLQMYDIYKMDVKELQGRQEETNKSLQKVKEHYKDVFMASVVEPKLKRKPESTEEGIPVDNLFTEWDLCHQLYGEIIAYTYGKKK